MAKIIKKGDLTFIDLFAGCGGLSLGLELSGFHPLYVNEINHDTMETYLRNRDESYPLLRKKYHSYDIKEMISSGKHHKLMNDIHNDYGVADVDLLVGGPPCQGFSTIGIRRSYSVEKEELPSNHLYMDMISVIKSIRPKMFMFENVRGILSARWNKEGQKGEIWKDIKQAFEEIPNYFVDFSLVYSKDYGVPQNRPRVILVGIRKDVGFKPDPSKLASGLLPEPSEEMVPDPFDLLSDLVDPMYENGGETLTYPSDATSEIQKWFRQDHRDGNVKDSGAPVTDHKYSKHSQKEVEKLRYMIDNNGEIPEGLRTKKFSQRVIPKRWPKGEPNLTVTASTNDYVHFSQPRGLSVRECARFQTFPDWYEFYGKRTTGGTRRAGNPREGLYEREVPKYTQIGNAVPVLLAQKIGEHFQSILSTNTLDSDSIDVV